MSKTLIASRDQDISEVLPKEYPCVLIQEGEHKECVTPSDFSDLGHSKTEDIVAANEKLQIYGMDEASEKLEQEIAQRACPFVPGDIIKGPGYIQEYRRDKSDGEECHKFYRGALEGEWYYIGSEEQEIFLVVAVCPPAIKYRNTPKEKYCLQLRKKNMSNKGYHALLCYKEQETVECCVPEYKMVKIGHTDDFLSGIRLIKHQTIGRRPSADACNYRPSYR
jgi:hypothetical protein